MTNEEAVEYIIKRCNPDYPNGKLQWELAINMAIDAMKKQIPMPVRITTSTKRCGNCGRQLSGIGNIHPERNYCVKCGQAIDWGGTNGRN